MKAPPKTLQIVLSQIQVHEYDADQSLEPETFHLICGLYLLSVYKTQTAKQEEMRERTYISEASLIKDCTHIF